MEEAIDLLSPATSQYRGNSAEEEESTQEQLPHDARNAGTLHVRFARARSARKRFFFGPDFSQFQGPFPL